MTQLSSTMPSARAGIRVAPRSAARRRWWEWIDSIATAGLFVLVLAGALFYVWQHVRVVRQGYEMERLREEHATLIQQNKALRLEAGQLRTLRRVEEVATTRLGMVRPKPGQVILLPESSIQ
jgi:cell division protein FtsL